MDFGGPLRLSSPTGSIVFNGFGFTGADDAAGFSGPGYVAPYFRLTEIVGMDMPSLRTTQDDRPQRDGAVLYDSFLGARYPTLRGMIVPAAGSEAEMVRSRQEMQEQLARVVLGLLRADGTLRWAPYGTLQPGFFGIASGGSLEFETLARIEQEFDDYLALDARHARMDAKWSVIANGGASSRDWATTDKTMPAAHARGLDIIATLSYSPPWVTGASSDDKVAPTLTAEFEAYAEFAADFVTRYPYVKAVEIWNEPNLGSQFWKPAANPADYTELVQLAYAAVKDANPDVLVVVGALAGAPTDGTDMEPGEFVDEMYANGGQGSFDAISIHPYVFDDGAGQPSDLDFVFEGWKFPDSTGSWLGDSNSIRQKMVDAGDRAKPIWVTEVNLNNVTEAVRSEHVGNVLARLASYPYVGLVSWYTWFVSSDARSLVDSSLDPVASWEQFRVGVASHPGAGLAPVEKDRVLTVRAWEPLQVTGGVMKEFHLGLVAPEPYALGLEQTLYSDSSGSPWSVEVENHGTAPARDLIRVYGSATPVTALDILNAQTGRFVRLAGVSLGAADYAEIDMQAETVAQGTTGVGSTPQPTNPGFETNTNDWQVVSGTLTRDTAVAAAGTASGRVTTSGTGVYQVQTFTYTGNFVVGNRYRVTAELRRTANMTNDLIFLAGGSFVRIPPADIPTDAFEMFTVDFTAAVLNPTIRFNIVSPLTEAPTVDVLYIDALEVVSLESGNLIGKVGEAVSEFWAIDPADDDGPNVATVELANITGTPSKLEVIHRDAWLA